MKEKKLRWYVVWDGSEELGYVIASTSHTKAKISALVYGLGTFEVFEAMKEKCQLVKQKLPIQPTKDGEFYPENSSDDLIECGLFSNIIY